MLGVVLPLDDKNRIYIKTAIEKIIPSLKTGEVSQYKLAGTKLNEDYLYVDGIIVRCYENALYYIASQLNYETERSKYLSLAKSIRQQRENFQLQAMSRLGLVAI